MSPRSRNPGTVWATALRWLAAALAAGVAVALLTAALQWRRRLARERAYDGVIWEAATRHGVSPWLVKGVIARESGFRAQTRGRAGEIGLMQITPGAVRDWEERTGFAVSCEGLLFDARLNIEIGTWYLARARRDWAAWADADVLALAQYNAGRANARKWAPEDRRLEALPRVRFPGTQRYIGIVLRYRERFEREYESRQPSSARQHPGAAEFASG